MHFEDRHNTIAYSVGQILEQTVKEQKKPLAQQLLKDALETHDFKRVLTIGSELFAATKKGDTSKTSFDAPSAQVFLTALYVLSMQLSEV
jgi:hypothetical protein